MNSILQDVRFGIRGLLKNPYFTIIAVFSIMLGIGANTAIFSLINSAVLKPLPVQEPEQLRMVGWSGPSPTDPSSGIHFRFSGYTTHATGRFKSDGFSYSAYCQLRDQTRDSAEVFAFSNIWETSTILTQDGAYAAHGQLVSGNFFSGLGLQPILGRPINIEDDRKGANPVTVLSYTAWKHWFGLDPEVLGKIVTIDRHPFTVVGILPENFHGVSSYARCRFDVYIPLTFQPQILSSVSLESPTDWWLQVMARLHLDVSEQQFQAVATGALNQAVHAAQPNFDKPVTLLLSDGSCGGQLGRDRYTKTLFMLMGIVTIVLIIACMNVAGLLLARGAARQHELSLRTALGAGPWRLIRQSLTESVLIAMIGAGLGLILAAWLKPMVSTLFGFENSTMVLTFDYRVFGFAVILALVSALLFGILPALYSLRGNPINSLKERSMLKPPRLRLGKVLVSGQMGLSLLLMIGAGLFTRSLINLSQIDMGFDSENVLIFKLDATKADYRDDRLIDFHRQFRDEISTLPGVQDVSYSRFPLLSSIRSNTDVKLPGRVDSLPILVLDVGDSFLTTMKIPLLLGRDFTSKDLNSSEHAVIVNQAFVQAAFPDENPIGKVFSTNFNNHNHTIVGVCSNIKYYDLKVSDEPTVFDCYAGYRSLCYEVRVSENPFNLVPAIRQSLASIDPTIPLSDIKTQRIQIAESIKNERIFTFFGVALAGLAVLLCCIGLYGLMSYHVTRRTGEIGIRIALGASPNKIAWPILRDALILAVIGVIIAVPAALMLTRFAQSILYGIKPNDPLTIVLSAMLLALITTLAALVPVRRAVKIDPMSAIRYE